MNPSHLHPANQGRGAQILTCGSAKVDHAADLFLKVMETFQAEMKSCKPLAVNLHGRHTWSEVLETMKEAETAYLNSSENRLRKMAQWVTVESASVLPYLELIPNGFYTSIICGGLKIVFGVRPLGSPKPWTLMRGLGCKIPRGAS